MSGPYTEDYFLGSVAGAEFYRLYRGEVVKPAMQLALLRAELSPGLRALDVGCGRGELLRQLEKRGVEAVGADFSAPALPIAQKTTKAPLLRCDARRLPFADASFDRIFFLGVLDHLADDDLAACFREFSRVLRPGGFVLANTCVNTDYYKTRTYGLRLALAKAMGLKLPRPPRSAEDEAVHVNEHNEAALRRFFQRIAWDASIEPRANDKHAVEELYGARPPADLPIRPARPWKRRLHALAFRGPLRRLLARELFCVAAPKPAAKEVSSSR